MLDGNTACCWECCDGGNEIGNSIVGTKEYFEEWWCGCKWLAIIDGEVDFNEWWWCRLLLELLESLLLLLLALPLLLLWWLWWRWCEEVLFAEFPLWLECPFVLGDLTNGFGFLLGLYLLKNFKVNLMLLVSK